MDYSAFALSSNIVLYIFYTYLYTYRAAFIAENQVVILI